MFDERGAANSGLVVLAVVLILAIVALFFFWPGGPAAEDEAELEVDVGSRAVATQPVAVAAAGGRR